MRRGSGLIRRELRVLAEAALAALGTNADCTPPFFDDATRLSGNIDGGGFFNPKVAIHKANLTPSFDW